MLYLRACTWCKGDVYLDKDRWGAYLRCLQCGREREVPEGWFEIGNRTRPSPARAARPSHKQRDVLR